jgi:hypothetical protein
MAQQDHNEGCMQHQPPATSGESQALLQCSGASAWLTHARLVFLFVLLHSSYLQQAKGAPGKHRKELTAGQQWPPICCWELMNVCSLLVFVMLIIQSLHTWRQTQVTGAHVALVQVTSRYLQPKPQGMGAASSQLASSGPLTGRPSLAAYDSAGWVELQHPNHASTPLMVPHGSAGPSVYSTVKGKARSGMPLPTPAPTAQKHQQQFITPAPAATPRMGLSRQQALQTPRGLSMSAAPSRCAGPGDRPGVFSADLTGAVTQPRLAGEGDMRAKLSAWREMKQQQGSRTAATADVFKEPAPKPTLFRGTAATRLNKEPSSGKKAVSSVGTAKPGAAERSSRVAAAAASRGAAATVTSPTASSTTGSSVAPTAGSVASPSAFSATMATLQGSGGKPRPGRPSSSKAGSGKPSPVPLLRLGQAGLGLGSPAASSQHQQQHDPSESCSPLPAVGSSTKIPRLNLSSLTSTPQPQQTYRHRQQLSSRGQQHGPMSSRGPSSSGGEPALPDATPRTARDALPSRVPRTPRTATPAGRSQQQSRRSSTSDGNDRALGQLDTLKSAAEQASRRLSPQSSAAKPAVPKLKLGALLGETSPGPAAATAAAAHHARPAAAGGHSCLSARGPAATIRGAAAAAHGTPTAPIRTSSDGGCTGGTPVQQHGRTPRGPAPAPTAACRLPTPRSLTSSMAAAAAGPAGAAPAAKKAEADKAEDVRQELRLLRMQQLQLRHLNARMEAALQAKREKVRAAVVLDVMLSRVQAEMPRPAAKQPLPEPVS